MIQYGVAWHDLAIATERIEAVHRVHDVIFSQVLSVSTSSLFSCAFRKVGVTHEGRVHLIRINVEI